MDLFKLRGVIEADNSKAIKAIDETSEKGQQSESKLGKAFSGIGKCALAVGKAVGTGMIAAGTAIAGLVTKSTQSYAQYEQLVGGVQTLFGAGGKSIEEYAASVGKSVSDVQGEYDRLMKAQQDVITNANNAYATAGMSANEYMETVTSFSASLLQSLDGDTVAAAAKADMAIRDMSDNANKMGTSMEMIQNAYNGFAKQNYTMLDNLKLGYGGTKEEMQRLLDKAGELSGQKFDISSYGDIVDAIHIIQDEMGITGTTADEAAGTISGSAASVGAAWQNLVMAMADDNADLGGYIDTFVTSLTTAADNMLPRIGIALEGVVDLVNQLAPVLIAELPGLLGQLLPGIITAATGLINSIVEILPGLLDMLITDVLPSLLDGMISIINAIIAALPTLIETLLAALPTLIPQLVNGLVSLILMLCTMLPQIIQPIIDNLPTIIMSIVDALMTNLPALIDGAIQLIVGLVAALPDIILTLLNALPEIIVMVVNGLLGALPTLIEGVGEIIASVTSAVWEFMAGFPEAIGNFVGTLWGNLSNIISGVWEVIKTYIKTVINTISKNISTVWTGIFNTIKGVVNGISTAISGVFNGIKDTVTKVWNKIKSAIIDPISSAKDKVGAIIDVIKGFFSGMKLEFPKIKMPHFSLTPKGWEIGDLLKGSIPKLAIDWYAKAMNEPMIMDRPTIFGYNGATGELMGGGEAGSEVVSGTNTLMQMIRGAVATQNETLAYYLQNVVDILSDYCPAVLDRMEHPIPAVIGADQAADALLGPLDYRFGILAAQKGRGR